MKLAQITESLHKKYLVETIEDNIFYHVSSRKIEGKRDPGDEGIHLSQSIEGAKSVKEERYSNRDAYLYIITLNDNLSLYHVDEDIGRWDAKNIAILLLSDKVFSSRLRYLEVRTLEEFSKLPNGKSTASNLLSIEVMMNKQGYNAISYENTFELTPYPSIMLFSNKLIKTCERMGKIQIINDTVRIVSDKE